MKKDEKFLQKIKQVPQFIETLLPPQRRILETVMAQNFPLKYFIVSIHEKQLTDFEQVHKSLQEDIERQQILIELSKNFPNKLVINKRRFDTIDEVFSYQSEVLKSIDSINTLNTFFFLSDLSDAFADNLDIDQSGRYGGIIELVQRGAELLEEQPSLASQSHDDVSYYEILNEIKKQLIQFVMNLDIQEVYRFVNENAFLIDQQALKRLQEEEEENRLKYQREMED